MGKKNAQSQIEKELEEILKDEESSLFDIQDSSAEASPNEFDVITRSSPEWQDHILKQFVDGEIIEINGKKCPTAYALGRVTRLLIGNVIEQGIVNIQHLQVPIPKVVVTYEVVIELYDWPGKFYRIRDVASVWECNTDDIFLGYQEETAATRAEGRCFRKALGYNGVAFEELTKDKNVAESVRKIKSIEEAPTDGTFQGGEKITERQANYIAKVCEELNIDIHRYIEMLRLQHGSGFLAKLKIILEDGKQKISEITKQEASDHFIKPFNVYKQGETEIPKVVLKKD